MTAEEPTDGASAESAPPAGGPSPTQTGQPQPTQQGQPQPSQQPTTEIPQYAQAAPQQPTAQVPPAVPAGVPQGTPPSAGKKPKKALKVFLIVVIVAIVVIGVGFGVSSLTSTGGDEGDEQQEEVSADTPATEEEDTGDADSKNVAYDEASDTYNSACLDDYDNVTAYAVLELDGEQLSALCRQQDYVWYYETDTQDEYFIRYGDRAALAIYGVDFTAYSQSDFGSMGIGSERGPMIIVDSVAGYSSSETAFTGASMLADVDDPVVDSESDTIWALVKDSGDNHYLVLVTAHGDGTYDLIMFNDEAVSSGLFESITDISGYSSVDELWQVINEGSSQEITEDTEDSGVLNT